ncbi:glycine--tRNA ligase [Candidatus Pacearchaeota archaeon]|nr:glycine--tRNA ligase [Candidatus Pacearchaeota archaeon]
MAFIVKKKIHGKDYYYLRQSVRENGKVHSKCLAYLGKTRSEAERKAKQIMKNTENNKTLLDSKNKKGESKKDSLKLAKLSVEDMATFCKKKGFVYQSGDIYGGLAGFWDFGHLGVELKNNIKSEWWQFHVREREDIVGIDGSIITHPKVWKASGHVDSFSDVLVVCKKCKKADKVDKHEIRKVKCPNCRGDFDWDNLKDIEQMFKTTVGLDTLAYLRPETAQLIFTNFRFVQDNARMKLPFGIAQIGKSFRNEIAPRDFLFRLREFEQMEIEYFIDPEEPCPYNIGDTEINVYSAEMQSKEQKTKEKGSNENEKEKGKEKEKEKSKEKDQEKQEKGMQKMSFKDALEKGIIKTKWHAYWLEQEFLWFIRLGARPEKFRIRQHVSDEKSHYALDTWDLEYEFPFGWKELQGMANRTDYDLKQHQKHSKTKMALTTDKGKKILPHVVAEPSQGVERAMLVFLFDSYCKDEERDNVVLRLDPKLAPVKAAIFPLVKKPEFEKLAKDVFIELKKHWNVIYDKSGSIGRRYARNDEVGTPYCITIDGDSVKNKDVTIRDRDTTKQVRVKISDVKNVIRKLLEKEIDFKEVGKPI